MYDSLCLYDISLLSQFIWPCFSEPKFSLSPYSMTHKMMCSLTLNSGPRNSKSNNFGILWLQTIACEI